jgi:hypothetical protein
MKLDDVKTGSLRDTRISPGETCILSGWRLRHKGSANLNQAHVWNVGTCRPDGKGETQVEDP